VTAPAGNPLARFVITVFLWLPVTFAVWYFTAPVLLWPAALVIRLIAKTGLSDLVRTIESDGGTLVFLTTLKPGEATGNAFISVDVNLLIYSFGLPLFAALTLAAREPRWPRILAIGYGVSLPLDQTGILSSVTSPLAAAHISVFVIATFDTDYVLIPEAQQRDAFVALERAGHSVISL